MLFFNIWLYGFVFPPWYAKNSDDYIEYVNQYAPKQSIVLEESYCRV